MLSSQYSSIHSVLFHAKENKKNIEAPTFSMENRPVWAGVDGKSTGAANLAPSVEDVLKKESFA